MQWLKLYNSIRRNKKVLSLPSDAARWSWIVLCTHANESQDRGRFGSEEELREVLGPRYRYVTEFRDAGLLDDLAVHDWEDYNPPVSTERTRRYRENAAGTSQERPREEEIRQDETRDPSLKKSASAENVRAVFDAWALALKKPASTVLDGDRASRIRKALTLYPFEDVLHAAMGIALDPFYMGKNDRNKVYNDVTIALKNGRNIEHFRDLFRENALRKFKDVAKAPERGVVIDERHNWGPRKVAQVIDTLRERTLPDAGTREQVDRILKSPEVAA